MGKTLERKVDELLAVKGAEAYAIIGKRVKKSPKTVRRWMKEGLPNTNCAFMLAKALGASDQEAHRIARECFPEGAKKAS